MTTDLEAARALFLDSVKRVEAEDFPAAEELLWQALRLAPERPSLLCNLAAVLFRQSKYAKAREIAERAVRLDPRSPQAWLNLGRCREQAGEADAAEAAYKRALEYDRDYADAWSNLGNIHAGRHQLEEALACYRKATTIRPDFAEAISNEATLLARLKRFAEAVRRFDDAMAIKPGLPWLRGLRCHEKQVLCDWSSFDEDCRQIVEQLAAGRPASPPFPLASLPATPAVQRQCAALYSAQMYPPQPPEQASALPDSGRLRIGYFSADFHNHATAYLAAGLFEQHDRERFEVFAFSFGPDRQDAMRQRLVHGFDHFHDVRGLSDGEIRRLARDSGIQIAVDLKGHTLDQRTGIFAGRAAPLQVSYLGFPGTMGAPYFDYILADATVLPPEHQPWYSEKAVWLPDTYQVTDSHRAPAQTTGTRADHGLPGNAFVFCCFNNPYKITPDVFAAWMRLLRDCPDSVLWLLESAPEAGANLRREAAGHGIDGSRLVFARYAEASAHLNRQRHADLFLDTFHYNAHTTASDALWAGLPVLTRLGAAFPGRVAASLLRAAGLPELVTQSTEDYVALATALYHDRGRLAALRDHLEQKRQTCALFDTARFCRGIEAAYTAMWQRHRAGLPPDAIRIPPQPPGGAVTQKLPG